MSYRSSIGQVQPGETLQLRRPLYTQDLTANTPSGATATISILDQSGRMVNAAMAQVSAISRMSLPQHAGFAGYDLEFTIVIPDNVEGTPEGVPYTAMMAFTVHHALGDLEIPAAQEAFTVVSSTDMQTGPQPSVMLAGSTGSVVYNFGYKPPHADVKLDLFYGNFPKGSYVDPFTNGLWTGAQLEYQFDATALQASLMPYAALWSVDGYQEIAPLFVINPSIQMAMRELHDFVNKNCSDWNTRELTFTPEQLIAALYNGACLFNAAVLATNFTMTNAMGMIRTFWIQYSVVWLLQAQVLNGIETDFSYTNSSISLDVDRASKYQQFADSLESSLGERLRPLKTVMAKRGNIQGDGSANPMALQHGAIGCVGLSLSPVSKVGTMWNPLSWRSMLLSPGSSAMMGAL